jgi:hypothetical protein
MARRFLFAVLLCLGGCGGPAPRPPAAAEVVKALEADPCVLDEDALLGWVRAGLEPLRRVRDAIGSGDPRVRPLDPQEVRRRLDLADVVLVADLHDRDLYRRALTRLLRAHAATADLGAGRIGLGFEAVAPENQELLRDLVHRRDREGLHALLRASWPWPVEAYLDVWLDRTLTGVVPFALGDGHDGRHGPGDLDDGARSPDLLPRRMPTPDLLPAPAGEDGSDLPLLLEFDDEWADIKYGLTFGRKNARVAAACTAWVRSAAGRRMFVLYGAAHLLEDLATGNGIRDLLVREGLRVEVVVPFLPSWERALHKRFGAAALDTVYEVLPGVLRVPPDPRELVGPRRGV